MFLVQKQPVCEERFAAISSRLGGEATSDEDTFTETVKTYLSTISNSATKWIDHGLVFQNIRRYLMKKPILLLPFNLFDQLDIYRTMGFDGCHLSTIHTDFEIISGFYIDNDFYKFDVSHNDVRLTGFRNSLKKVEWTNEGMKIYDSSGCQTAVVCIFLVIKGTFDGRAEIFFGGSGCHSFRYKLGKFD